MKRRKHSAVATPMVVEFLTVLHDETDWTVSFAIGPQALDSLTLMRSPTYEVLLPADERGVTIVNDDGDSERVLSLNWKSETVEIKTTGRRIALDIRRVAAAEVSEAKALLRRMNFDRSFSALGIADAGPALVYDPEQAPDPTQWQALTEAERQALVRDHHHRAGVRLPSPELHALIHEVVENQIAMGLEPVLRAMQRLQDQGLARHDALHAIGSVVSAFLFEQIRGTTPDPKPVVDARYGAAVERLNAQDWLNSG